MYRGRDYSLLRGSGKPLPFIFLVRRSIQCECEIIGCPIQSISSHCQSRFQIAGWPDVEMLVPLGDGLIVKLGREIVPAPIHHINPSPVISDLHLPSGIQIWIAFIMIECIKAVRSDPPYANRNLSIWLLFDIGNSSENKLV